MVGGGVGGSGTELGSAVGAGGAVGCRSPAAVACAEDVGRRSSAVGARSIVPVRSSPETVVDIGGLAEAAELPRMSWSSQPNAMPTINVRTIRGRLVLRG